MATAPVVQTLAQVMADLNPAIAGQTGIINQQRAGLGAKYDAQRSGLEAEKVQGFNTINNQATGRGMSFSGIPLDEQATYLSTKYLPGVQATYAQQNEEDLALAGQAAAIQTDMTKYSLGRIDNQTQNLNQWNLNERNIEVENARAAENRAFEQAQAEATRQFQASQNAQDRAASAAANAAAPTPNISGIRSYLSGKRGGDGKVSPNVWAAGMTQWMQQGGDPTVFVMANSDLINPNHRGSYAGVM